MGRKTKTRNQTLHRMKHLRTLRHKWDISVKPLPSLLKGQPWQKDSKNHREWRTPRKQPFYINRIDTHEFIWTDIALAPTSQVCTRGNLRAERSGQMTLFVLSFIKYIVITVSVHSNTPNHPCLLPSPPDPLLSPFPFKKENASQGYPLNKD